MRQSELDSALPWPIKHGAKDVAARAVAHLDRAMAHHGVAVEPPGRRWSIFQGVQSGADAYTARVRRRLTTEVKRRPELYGAKTGEPILELPPGREGQAPWAEQPELLARTPESRAIMYGAIDDRDYTSIVWIGREDVVSDRVVAALERWRPVLATRAEFARNSRRRWFETAWPRDKDELRAPKVIALAVEGLVRAIAANRRALLCASRVCEERRRGSTVRSSG